MADAYVSAYFDNDEERKAALQLLHDPVEYEGLVEGYASEATIAELTKRQLVVTIQSEEEAPYETPLQTRSKYNDTDLQDRLLELKQRAQVVPPPEVLESLGPDDAMAAPAPPPPQAYKVTLAGPIRPDWRDALQNLGAEISDYTRGTYRIYIDPFSIDALRALPFVKSAEEYTVNDTVSSSVLLSIEKKKKEEEEGALAGDAEAQRETFDVIVHREGDLPHVVDYIKSRKDAEYVEQSSNAVRFRAAADSVVVATVANMPEVKRMVNTLRPALYVDHASEIVGLAKVNQAIPPKQWSGSGEIVAVLDSGIDATHPDFDGQFAVPPISFRGCSVDDTYGHGTHVAGIIGGTGKKSNGKIRGVAPGAKLVVVGMVDELRVPQIPLDIGELLKIAVDAGAKIINASWGRRLGSTYDSGSHSVDKFIYENPEILVVVAAGNESTAPTGTYEFKSIGAPATAKNVLTVGASNTDRAIPGTWGTFRGQSFPESAAADDPIAGDPQFVAGISSRGPTDFDSIKPDVLAPGTFILSTRAAQLAGGLEWKAKDVKPDDGYVFIGGTSMATPVVSGLAAVLRQYLREERNTPQPSAALLKAILISATHPVPQRKDDVMKDIGFPDFDQGFGRIDLSLVIPQKLVFADVANNSKLALESRAKPGSLFTSLRTYKINIAAGAASPLVLTLAWTDRPGRDVQNQLQLDIRGPADLFLIGNTGHVFRKDPRFDAKASNGVVIDKRNNVQQIRIDAAAPGEYTIHVAAQNTVLPPQGYALAVVGNIDGDLVLV
jgi:serine protease AprX